MAVRTFEYRFFILLLVVVSLAFGWILLPFYGAVFWAVVLAILFMPVQRRLLKLLGNRRNLATLLTTLSCLLLVVLPVGITGMLLIRQGTALYKRIQSGELNLSAMLDRFNAALPERVRDALDSMGFGDWASMREQLVGAARQGSELMAGKALSIGQDTFGFLVAFFVMLYLLFFLLRDGRALLEKIREAIPLSEPHKRRLLDKFTQVVRATVKGNLVVALIQGGLGGAIFAVLGIPGAMLWGVLMVLLSLLPAVGAGLIWGPVAIYFFVSGDPVKAAILTAFGVLVIGLVDNILRPILVGKDTRMPDYLVLISTLGGLALFGLNGFVIGPLIAALFISTWSIFSNQSKAPAVAPAPLLERESPERPPL